MKTKFTKGEWYVSVENGNAKVYYPHGFLTSAGVIKVDDSRLDGESWIEMMKRTDPAREASEAESNANMHLISCAPEMYEMLELMSTMIPNVKTNRDEFYLPEIKRNVDKLLAKARGEK